MVSMPNGPEAPQRRPFHQSTCTLSASPVGLSLTSGTGGGGPVAADTAREFANGIRCYRIPGVDSAQMLGLADPAA